MADSSDCLFPIASLTMVCRTIDSSFGIVAGESGFAEGRAGRLPLRGGVGLFSSYAVCGSGKTSTAGSEVCWRWL